MKKLFTIFFTGFSAIVVLSIFTQAHSQGLPGFIKKIGNALVPVSNDYTLGDDTHRWNIFADEADIDTLTFGGFGPGDLTIEGNLAIDDALSIDEATDAQINLTADTVNATPVEGDIWRASDGLKYYDGTTTFDLLSGGGFWDFNSVCSSGCDYADIAALIAGETAPYKAYLLSSVTEDSDVPLDGNFHLMFNGFTYDVGNYKFTSSAGVKVVLEGQNQEVDELQFAHTSSSNVELFDDTNAEIFIKDLKIDNNSTQTGSRPWPSSTDVHIQNLTYEGPNIATSGVYITTASSTARDIKIVGGGTSATFSFYVSNGIVNNVTLAGTLSNASQVEITGGVVTNMLSAIDAQVKLSGGILNGYSSTYASNGPQLEITASALATNIKLNGNGVDCLNLSGASNVLLSNFYLGSGGLNMDSSSASNNRIANGYIALAHTISGDNNIEENITYVSTLTINSGANNNQVDGQFNGNVSITGNYTQVNGDFGTSDTLTINSGATGTTGAVVIDQAPTDGGTSTSLEYTVY